MHSYTLLKHKANSHSVNYEMSDVLLGRVRELVLSPAIIRFLDARVSPQHLYRANVRLLERCNLLYVHVTHHQGIVLEEQNKNIQKDI